MDRLADSKQDRPVGAFNPGGIKVLVGARHDGIELLPVSAIWQHADAGGQQVGAAQVASTATIAISLLFAFGQLLRCFHTRVIQVPVVAKMARAALARPGNSSPLPPN